MIENIEVYLYVIVFRVRRAYIED